MTEVLNLVGRALYDLERGWVAAAKDALGRALRLTESPEIKLRAERRAGEMLAEMEKAKGTRGQLSGGSIVRPPENRPTLSDLGIDKHDSSRWQKIAAVPEPDFERYLTETKAAGRELTSSAALLDAELGDLSPLAKERLHEAQAAVERAREEAATIGQGTRTDLPVARPEPQTDSLPVVNNQKSRLESAANTPDATPEQKAVLALDILPFQEAQAAARRGVRNDIREIIPSSEQGKATEKAAAAVGVNPRYVSDAKRIQREAPAAGGVCTGYGVRHD